MNPGKHSVLFSAVLLSGLSPAGLLLAGLSLAGLLLVSGCTEKNRPVKEMTLMSYNVGAFSKYLDNSTGYVAELIKRTGADLVALNETDSVNRRHDTYQVRDLAQEIGDWDYAFSKSISYAGGSYGNGVVSRSKILDRAVLPLPRGEGAEDRSVCIVETEDCVFAAVHLDHIGSAARESQARIINDYFTLKYKDSKKPVFLCGDMNDLPTSKVIATLDECWDRLSTEDFTFSSKEPKECIDYVYALKGAAPVKVLSYSVLKDGTQDLSDHLPVLIKVSFK